MTDQGCRGGKREGRGGQRVTAEVSHKKEGRKTHDDWIGLDDGSRRLVSKAEHIRVQMRGLTVARAVLCSPHLGS